MGSVFQNLQVILGAQPIIAPLAESVVGDAEASRREQIFAVSVIRERTRLAHERIDDVSVVNCMSVATHQSRQRVDVLVRVPDFDTVCKQSRFDLFADQPAVHRISIAVDVNQAAGVDAAGHLQATVEPSIGQCAERRRLFGEAVAPAGVANRHHVLQEIHVLLAAGKVAAAPQEQCLIHGGLEVPMRRLAIAILVRLPNVDPVTGHAVVRQQVAIARLKLTGH